MPFSFPAVIPQEIDADYLGPHAPHPRTVPGGAEREGLAQAPGER